MQKSPGSGGRRPCSGEMGATFNDSSWSLITQNANIKNIFYVQRMVTAISNVAGVPDDAVGSIIGVLIGRNLPYITIRMESRLFCPQGKETAPTKRTGEIRGRRPSRPGTRGGVSPVGSTGRYRPEDPPLPFIRRIRKIPFPSGETNFAVRSGRPGV